MTFDLKSAYLLHSPDLTSYVRRRVPDRSAASDVVHDAFVRMAEQRTLKVNDARSYLYRVVRNLLLDQKKQNMRRRTFPVSHDELLYIADEAPSPEDVVDARLRLEYLQKLIGELPFKVQQIFVLNRVDGLSYAEVARHLDISESSVQKHLALAVQHIMRRTQAD